MCNSGAHRGRGPHARQHPVLRVRRWTRRRTSARHSIILCCTAGTSRLADISKTSGAWSHEARKAVQTKKRHLAETRDWSSGRLQERRRALADTIHAANKSTKSLTKSLTNLRHRSLTTKYFETPMRGWEGRGAFFILFNYKAPQCGSNARYRSIIPTKWAG